jgi:hypothetical protein
MYGMEWSNKFFTDSGRNDGKKSEIETLQKCIVLDLPFSKGEN